MIFSRRTRIFTTLLVLAGATGLIVLARHAPPIREVSDGAILEIYTLEALKGKLLLGPYSRFGWHHPGPLYFYLEAPWYWLSGGATAGMQAGALAINLAAVAAIAWVFTRCASAPSAIGVSCAVGLYALRSGSDFLVSAWNPHVIILPMLAFVTMAAALAATGRRGLLFWLVAIGSFLVQTHLALTPIVVVLGATAVVAGRRSLRGVWTTAGALAFALWLPPLIEQLRHSPGNMTAIAAFFGSNSSPGQPVMTAVGAWAAALTSVLRPDFIVAWGFDVLPPRSSAPLVLAIMQVIALACTAAWARRRNAFALWLSMMCLTATCVSLLATTRIRDQIVDHEIFWMSALGALNAGVIAGVLAAAASGALRPRVLIGRAATSTVCVAAVVVVAAVGLMGMRHALQRTRTTDDHSVDVVADEIERHMADAHARRPMIHIEAAVWPIAAGALLRIDKENVRFAVDDRWKTMFGEGFVASGREDLSLTIAGSPFQPRVSVGR